MRDNLELTYDYEIRNKEGQLVYKSRKKKCHSFVKAFINLLHYCMQWGHIATIDTGNVSRTTGYGLNSWAGITVTTWGSVIGTGTNAESVDDYALQTKIAHGTGAGQMQYGAMSYGAPASDASTTTLRFTRVFSNDSGGSITVEEIGLIMGANPYFLVFRDLTGGVAVAHGESLTLNYNMTTTV